MTGIERHWAEEEAARYQRLKAKLDAIAEEFPELRLLTPAIWFNDSWHQIPIESFLKDPIIPVKRTRRSWSWK